MVVVTMPQKYGEYFYELYTRNTRRTLQNNQKALAKRKKKVKKAMAAVLLEGNAACNNAHAIDSSPYLKEQLLYFSAFPVTHIELEPNASRFAVFSAIRAMVLEAETRHALFRHSSSWKRLGVLNAAVCCLLCASSCAVSNCIECSCHTPLAGGAGAGGAAGILAKRARHDSPVNSEPDSDEDECWKEPTTLVRVPLIVGAGLRSLFELIAEARNGQPLLCTKALQALLDVIQGQQPETFKHEPDELIAPLYELLLNLATQPSPAGGVEANWSALACSALLGLCIARGDTGKMLRAIAALLMAPPQLAAQHVQLPAVLASLQQSVISTVLNKPSCPDLHNHGLPFNSLVDQFALRTPLAMRETQTSQPAMASDGTYIYLLLGGALLKIGSGFGGSCQGHAYAQNEEFTKERCGWLGYCGGQLYFRRHAKRNADHMHVVNTETLTIRGVKPLSVPLRDGYPYVLFSDEDSLNVICTNRDDTLVIKRLNMPQGVGAGGAASAEPAPPYELPLQLARKKFRTLGYAAFEDEVLNQQQIQKILSSYNLFDPKLPNDVEIQGIACGKEFGLVRASNGKVYYYGKSLALGLKAPGRTPTMKLTELLVSKLSSTVLVALGHDGVHALLVNDDGTVYFAGTARRGEDGDTSKNRRQPKAAKPRKIGKVEGHVVTHAACNNGTSALVTKAGKLIMYGKDTAHCDAAGFVSDFSEQQIMRVALGKAHCVALNARGQLFTFGLNNKGQCGRCFASTKAVAVGKSVAEVSTDARPGSVAVAAADEQLPGSLQVAAAAKCDDSQLCDYDDHSVVQGQCRVCIVCRECTGYNVSCVSNFNVPSAQRLPGEICSCGHGDAGCAKCGLCSKCIALQETENDVSKDAKQLQSELQRQRSKSLLLLRQRKEPKSSDALPLHTATGEQQQQQQQQLLLLDSKETPRVAPLPPQLLVLPGCSAPVVQLACGLHHTVVLTQSGDVYTFGSNQYGQLGSGDLQAVAGPLKVHVPAPVSQIAAGSNHSVLMTHKGMVYTFGNYQKGQLGRLPNDYHKAAMGGSAAGGGSSLGDDLADLRAGLTGAKTAGGAGLASALAGQRQKFLWHCTPGAVFGLGPSFGKRATWIGASGDQTFIKIDESLITTSMLPKMNVVANKQTILLIPNIPLSFHTLTINRRDGSCTAHYRNQVNFVQIVQNNKAKALPEINQNFAAQPATTSPAVAAGSLLAGAPSPPPLPHSNDQMSASMHEARNQIFILHENQQQVANEQQQQQNYRRQCRKEQQQQHESGCSGSTAGGGGTCRSEKSQPQIAFALDPVYHVLWVYDGGARRFQFYNVVASEFPEHDADAANYRALLSPELSLPKRPEARVARSQAALNLLACLDVLTSTQDAIPECFEEPLPRQQCQTKEAQLNEYQIANRFDNFGGGWGYSGHSVEAIRFSSDTDITLCGFGMFGGRGEYTCKLKLYDLGADGGSGGYEKDGVLISETKEVPFECAARSTHHMLLPKPVSALAGRWYLVWARIAGPSSDCGSCGQATITTEDQVVLSFKSSKKANNGTDANSGQIPSVLYRLVTQECSQPAAPYDGQLVPKISKAFANSVSKECFESLVLLLRWSWQSFKANLREQQDATPRQLHVQQALALSYVNKSCLRLLRKYINEIYPQRGGGGGGGNASANSICQAVGKRVVASKNAKESDWKKDNCGKLPPRHAGAVKCAGEVAAHFSGKAMAGCSSVSATARKPNLEDIQLAECIGHVRALLITIFCDDSGQDLATDGGGGTERSLAAGVLDECHISFVACFDAFYPTSSLKWNCLCNLLSQMDKLGTLHSRLLSAILAGLCSPFVKLRATFSLLNGGANERHSTISPSDNSGLPMLCSTEAHQYPILVEQMIYRTQQEKCDFAGNAWTFKDVLVRLLEIVAQPIRGHIESVFGRRGSSLSCAPAPNQGLIDNCCQLLARVLAEIVYQTSLGDYDKLFLPPRSLHSTGSRFARCDVSRTWNTGNFGPDAIAFAVDRAGIAIAGAMVYSGSGSYDYQLELLYDNTADLQSQHKWETLESVTGTYDQDAVHNDMAEIKFERPVHIKENMRYALRLCSQGARTCSGDAGLPSLRGPCGSIFHFYACDLSFNGTTPQRGQIPCVLYYSTPLKHANHSHVSGGGGQATTNDDSGADASAAAYVNELITRETALQIAADITKKCAELLILARNTLAASLSPSDNSSTQHTQTIDSEHNITPIEEHMDINWANNSRTAGRLPGCGVGVGGDGNVSMARDITKRIESFSKGIMETLKFDKRSTNPFEMEIEIGATEIHAKDLLLEEQRAGGGGVHDLNCRNGVGGDHMAKLNGNERCADSGGVLPAAVAGAAHNNALLVKCDSDEAAVPLPVLQLTVTEMLDIFNAPAANMFHTLLPLVCAHIANLACSDPKCSVQILGLIKELLPHIAALNQLCGSDASADANDRLSGSDAGMRGGTADAATPPPPPLLAGNGNHNGTTSNHYCVVESEHPYRSAAINCYRVEFPACVQWLTIEFDALCGTAQLEDYLLVSIPLRPLVVAEPSCPLNSGGGGDYFDALDNNTSQRLGHCRNATLLSSCYRLADAPSVVGAAEAAAAADKDWIVVRKFNTAANWLQNVLVLPGNCVEFSLETASLYAQDPNMNRYGFKCLVVGYDNPMALQAKNACLLQLEQELAYLGGMCSANLMKKDLNLPDDKDVDDLAGVEETISAHHALLSKGFALAEPFLAVHQALDSYLPLGSQSIERQFLKDFINCAPGSAGARLAAWLQPESRLDPNKCELNTITEPLRYGWPTQITVAIRDQYGDAAIVPELKVEIKAIPTGGGGGNGNIKMRRTSSHTTDDNKTTTTYGGVAPPPLHSYEATIKERMCFKAISFMKSYNNYSFEELRYSSPIQTRVTETLYAQDMDDGTFSVHWTPSSVGGYCLTVSIDGIPLEDVYRVEVQEGGQPPPSQRYATKKAAQPPSKFRKFYTKNTAGLRIRSHPTLQSEQVGVIKLNGVITFIDEIENDDGVWLRLSTESIRQHCTMGWYPTEAWCLQYNQHLDKTLLHPVTEAAVAAGVTAAAATSVGAPLSTMLPNSNSASSSSSSSSSSCSSNAGNGAAGVQATLLQQLEPTVVLDWAAVGKAAAATNPFLTSPPPVMTDHAGSRALKAAPPEAAVAAAAPGDLQATLAGVVGDGASKLHALQKWLKGSDDGNSDGSGGNGTPSKERKREPVASESVGEIAVMSVRELVRVMGGGGVTEPLAPRSNGNGDAPTDVVSPMQISVKDEPTTNVGNIAAAAAAATTTTTTTAARDDDVTNGGELLTEAVPPTKFDIASMRRTTFTASEAAALLSTPKHAPRKWTQLQREGGGELVTKYDTEQLDDEMGLLQITTTTTTPTGGGAQQKLEEFSYSSTVAVDSVAGGGAGSDGALSETLAAPNDAKNAAAAAATTTTTTTMGPIKRAMPPSLAESIRAVFAAFIWHEGVVHDCIASASFLKFHPTLPKEGASVVARRDPADSKRHLSREQKAQQRHSVEVANAGSYLNIRPSTLEALTKSGNSSQLNNRKYRKHFNVDTAAPFSVGESEQQQQQQQQLQAALSEIVLVLPPALRCLVYLWDQVSANCIQIVQSNTLEQQQRVKTPASPTSRHSAAAKPDKQLEPTTANGSGEREAKRLLRKKKKDDGSWCEICEIFLPIPVTYHMRIAHPGCGKSAKGKGYNSVGIFCEGWAGNCGEGGKGASSWFLMCDMCRDKFMAESKSAGNVNELPSVANIGNDLNLFDVKSNTLIANSEIYYTMRENATFLLELASSVSNLPNGLDVAPPTTTTTTTTNAFLANANCPALQKRSPQQMPVVIEHQPMCELSNKPSTSRLDAARNSRLGLRMSGKFGGTGAVLPCRRSFLVGGTPPEHVWIAPDTFAALDTLSTVCNDGSMPYEMFGLNSQERPLSEVSHESCDVNYDLLLSGSLASSRASDSKVGLYSKFHRSYSMGQGWGLMAQPAPTAGTTPAANGYKGASGVAAAGNADEAALPPKVVYRRRNNSTSEGDGALLICYPSENLRKLVPDSMLASGSVVQTTTMAARPAASAAPTGDAANNCLNANEQTERRSGGGKQPAHSWAHKWRAGEPPQEATAAAPLLQRPALAFITQKHELHKLRYTLRRSLRIAACRIYALQALNWLLRSVTQSVCLHDLMWWFVSALNVCALAESSAASTAAAAATAATQSAADSGNAGRHDDNEAALEHPVSYTQINGNGFAHAITQSLHQLLQSVADLTLHLPLGSPLQRIAIQCFGIRFRQADHQFLHSSHVFGNISKILSKTDEQDEALALSNLLLGGGSGDGGLAADLEPHSVEAGAKIITYTELCGMFEVTVSSRPALADSLTDNSTETFWESDEEDRNKSKIIELSMTKYTHVCRAIHVHIDNSRDIQNKVLTVSFYAGQSLGDMELLKSSDVEPKGCAWLTAKVGDASYTHFRLEFHGTESTLRVRQIKLLGLPCAMSGLDEQWQEHYWQLGVGGGAYGTHATTHNSSSGTAAVAAQQLRANLRLAFAPRIQQQLCEAETLRVFRLITAQVFGKLIATGAGQQQQQQQSVLGLDTSGTSLLADSLDLREHMVGILFSRSKLSHLQKQVIVHIVHAIRKEAQRAKEDWELVNLTNCFKQQAQLSSSTSAAACAEPKSESSSERYRAPDTYCFEMLSMVLALSGSVVGRSYLSHQYGLLKDLLSLLHTGSDRVQRQVTALLRRILPEIPPENFAELLGVQKLPPLDYSIAHQSVSDFDMNRLGLLDILLAVIAKSLQLQVKVKTSTLSKPLVEKTPAFVRACNTLDVSVYLLKQKSRGAEGHTADPAVVCSYDTAALFQRSPATTAFEQATSGSLAGVANSGRSTLKSLKEAKKNLNQRWFLNGIISMKQAESIIALVRDLASGKLSEKWSQLTKAAVAEAVLNLTRLDEIFRTPENCVKTPTLWLAMASLCVLDQEHVEKLSSGQWSKVSSDTRPMCSNHDDGETAAIIQCELCGSLCNDCDRFLHLNRKKRSHKRTVCKEEEEAIRVELHESCGRTKLFWLLALADSKTLKAMVEFRDGSHTLMCGPLATVGRCRFCGVTGNSGLLEIGNVCADAQCQEYAANSCLKTKPCGHMCGGVAGERKCLPCLQHVCHARENELAEELHEPKLTQDADDMCMICFVEALSCAPSTHLECGHVFHYHCCKAVLEKRWHGPRITFGFSLCPICKTDIQHALLVDILQPINLLKQDVKRKALMRLKYEGVICDNDAKDLSNLAMDRYAYYVCFKCQKAYYGGEARCDVEIGEKFDPAELVCGGCSDVARAQMCPKHGTDFLEYKCRYCCSVAVFFCFGTTHFCDTCHDDFQRLTNIPKSKLPQCPAGPKAKQLLGDECPLHIMHPPTGEEFALGCGVCRNAQTF